MKPAGRERDKQIAELKEINYGCHKENKRHNWIGKICATCGLAFGKRYKKNWSTSWNDAKELEQEMVDNGCAVYAYAKKLHSNSYFVRFQIEKMPTIQVSNNNLDEAIADVVSQAWIKWKEGV